ncbi:hypothetical protein E2562_026114 [Oryza meyeriana var. granulata]|uniref:Uncharacterized protein n=1 Tax=Oryza meyeriana var. granulata TaxID=110450 RepID=A0A6G1BZT8_9ORYZ|nr:hypothetical protein E2562_026113 [Oryza meyeriana var. granulata]KAF0893519.1 hypothetical protein E2562_026114 [Oryza meyeriana var. granulata]
MANATRVSSTRHDKDGKDGGGCSWRHRCPRHGCRGSTIRGGGDASSRGVSDAATTWSYMVWHSCHGSERMAKAEEMGRGVLCRGWPRRHHLGVVGDGNETGRSLGWCAGVVQSSAGSHSGSAFRQAAGGPARLAQGG